MKDADGFDIKCIHSDWMIYDDRDNKDFICRKYFTGGYHHCFCDEHCLDYKPEGINEISEGNEGNL